MADEPTPFQRENMSLAQRALQLYVGRDIEGLLALYHPDVVVTAPDFMNAGPFHGHEGYMEWISRWNEAWDDFDFDLRAIEPVGERHVVLSILVSGRGAGSGVEVEQMSYWVAEIRDKLGTYLEVLLTEDWAFELARRREADSGKR
jgi:ketosteroid isomerase-like protein